MVAATPGPLGRLRGTGMLSLVALSAVYGLAGFCSGPVLGAILTRVVGSPASRLSPAVVSPYPGLSVCTLAAAGASEPEELADAASVMERLYAAAGSAADTTTPVEDLLGLLVTELDVPGALELALDRAARQPAS